MKKQLVYLILITFLLSILPTQIGQAQTGEPIVKVKLVNYLGNKTEIQLKPNGDYITSDSAISLIAGNTYILKQESGKLSLYIDGRLLKSLETFSARPLQVNTQLYINNKPYIGSFDFVIENNLYVRPINSVYMEDYLKGVVPHEMYPSWNLDALKAQAVAARTYAMSYLNRGIINDTISYQVYGGASWYTSTTKAVEETSGLILHSNGRLIDAVYSASNGGKTESNANAWGNTPVSYLTIKEDKYDPRTSWTYSFYKKQIDLNSKDLSKYAEWWSTTKETDTAIMNTMKTWLSNNGYANKDMKIVSIPEFSLSGTGTGGRVSKGSITIEFLVKGLVDTNGNLVLQRVSYTDIHVSKIRAMIGNRVMPSYMVDAVSTDTDVITVKGRGDGHGVGMSQWGAKYMGDAGHSYQDILNFYYTGITIPRAYEVSVNTTPPSTITEVVSPTVPVEPVPDTEAETQPVPNTDTKATIIKDLTGLYNATNKSVQFTYSIDEESMVTTYVKDTKGTVVQTIENKVKKPEGKYTLNWNATTIPNGFYTFMIISTDLAGNSSSAVKTFTINQPDIKAPAIKNGSVKHDQGTKKVTLSYIVDETSNITVVVKNSKGIVMKSIGSQSKKASEKQILSWNESDFANGTYTVILTATDMAKNKSQVSYKFTVAKVLKGKITMNGVLLKQKASNSSKTLAKLSKNKEVTILKKTGSWYYIQNGNIKGYVPTYRINQIK